MSNAPTFILLNQGAYEYFENKNNPFYPSYSTLSIDNQAGLMINQKREEALWKGMTKHNMFSSVDTGLAIERCPNLFRK